MVQTFLKSAYIAGMLFVLLMLIVPILHASRNQKKVQDSLMQQFVLTIDNSKLDSLAFITAHAKILMEQNQISADRIVLVALEQGNQVLRKGNFLQPQVEALLATGIQVFACESSMTRSAKSAGMTKDQLIHGVKTTPNGKQLVDKLMEEGYVNSLA